MKKLHKILLSIISVLLVCILITSTCLIIMFYKKETVEDFKTLIYFPSYINVDKVFEETDFSKITHINFAFALVDANTLEPTLTEDASKVLKKLVAFLVENNYDCKILLSIGGAGASNFCEMARAEDSRNRFAKKCKEIIDEYNIAGIDMDWEFPGHNWEGISSCKHCMRDYTLLMQAIRDEIGNNYLLTFAGTANFIILSEQENRKLAKIVDFVNVMNYDYNNKSHSNFSKTKTNIFAWHLSGYKKEQINLGVPFYGRSDDKTLHFKGYNQIMAMVDNNEATLKETKNQTFAKVGKSTISFDSPELIARKMKWARKSGYGGGFCWQISTDRNNELLNAMANS